MTTPTKPTRLVKLGRSVITASAAAMLSPETTYSLLLRHGAGDWGDLDPEDWQANEDVMNDPEHCGRLFSSYRDVPTIDDPPSTTKVWVITDAPETPDAITTVLLPEDY